MYPRTEGTWKKKRRITFPSEAPSKNLFAINRGKGDLFESIHLFVDPSPCTERCVIETRISVDPFFQTAVQVGIQVGIQVRVHVFVEEEKKPLSIRILGVEARRMI